MALGLGLAIAVAAPGLRAADVAQPDEMAAPDDATALEEADAADEQPIDVVVDGDRVTATFSMVPPDTIVREIANAAGAEVVGATEGSDPTSIDLDDVPIDRALERALRGQSFTIVYGGDGSVRRIRLHGASQQAAAAGGRTVSIKAPTSAGAALAPHKILDVRVPISSIGPLAEHLGTDTATLGQLYRIAVDEDQAALRIAAVDASMAAIESDPSLQTSVDAMLESTDDQALAILVRGSAGKRANELVSRILSRTRRPQVRQRAVTLLRQLRQTN